MSTNSIGFSKPKETKIINGDPVVISDMVVHTFDVVEEDVAIFAAEHLWEWETSEEGQWVMENAVETPWWSSMPGVVQYSCVIVARLTEKDQTYFNLRWRK